MRHLLTLPACPHAAVAACAGAGAGGGGPSNPVMVLLRVDDGAELELELYPYNLPGTHSVRERDPFDYAG